MKSLYATAQVEKPGAMERKRKEVTGWRYGETQADFSVLSRRDEELVWLRSFLCKHGLLEDVHRLGDWESPLAAEAYAVREK